MLILPEQILLLILDEEKGKISEHSAPLFRFALSSAMLAELVLQGKVALDEKKKLCPADLEPIQDDMLNEVLGWISSAPRPRKVNYWINYLARNSKAIRQGLLDRLVKQNILLREDKRYQLWIPNNAFPQSDASAKYWVKLQLRQGLLTNQFPDDRGIMLLVIMNACHLLDFIFTRDEIKKARKGIEQIIQSNELTPALRASIQEINTATAAVASVILNS